MSPAWCHTELEEDSVNDNCRLRLQENAINRAAKLRDTPGAVLSEFNPCTRC